MSTPKFTEGPWSVEEIGQDDLYGHVYISGHITSPLHTYCGNTSSRRDSIAAPDSMTRADAYLIAAAPDLYQALQELLLTLEDPATLSDGSNYPRLRRAERNAEMALAYARGEDMHPLGEES